MLHRKVSVSTDKMVRTPANLPSHFYPRSFPEDIEQPSHIREILEASDPIFRCIVSDAISILHQYPHVDRVHVYQNKHLPEGALSPWPVELLFVDSLSEKGHVVAHSSGDYHWATDIDDADTVVLGYICEAIHQSLPIIGWKDFIKILEDGEYHEMVIDWIAESKASNDGDKETLWIRFSYTDSEERISWVITSTDEFRVKSIGFTPVQVIEFKKDKAKDEVKIIAMMDDLILEPVKSK